MSSESPLAHTEAPERSCKRSFWSLITTQFQGAFSDNAHKVLVLYLILGMGLSQSERDLFVPGVQFLFALPFILFSMTGGYLADRYSKRTVTIGTKVMEIAVMGFAPAALALVNVRMMLAAVFLKTAISIADDVFTAADRLAERLGVSRSHLYATAVAEYVARHRAAR